MASFHVVAGPDGAARYPEVRHIEIGDLYDCLRAGWEDFMAKPSHVVFIVIVYPLIGVVLAAWTSGANALPMLFPLASGFALLGPFAAIGLYEISRRRELGLDASWRHALSLRRSPALPSIAAVGAMLFAIFIAWLLAAQGLYTALLGPRPPASLAVLATQLLFSAEGWMLIVAGNAIGLLFALVVLSTTVVAFPLLIDRDPGAWVAITTSARAFAANPAPMLAWGFVVALMLVLGSLPLFAGLVVVIPVLGHATWHLYRKVVADGGRERLASPQ